MIDNMDIKKESVSISVNIKIYPIEAVYFASYMFIENNFVLLSGEPEEEIFVEIRPKQEKDAKALEIIGREFNNELINYSVYVTQSKRTLPLRHLIMQKAFLSNIDEQTMSDLRTEVEECDCESEKPIEKDSAVESNYADDPAGIAASWNKKEKKGK